MKHLEAVVLDWAGTVVDFGSFAPTTIFVQAFKEAFDFDISLEEARGPMGVGKWDHIRALGDTPAIESRWKERFGKPMSDDDVTSIYNTFMPLQVVKVVEHADLIPGTLETLTFLQQQGLKIGSCSGYPRKVMEALMPVAAANGYTPGCVVASDDLKPGSRPGPWMALQNIIELGIGAVYNCVKVDDSAPGIEEGLNAGMWTVGVSLSGNEACFTQQQFLQSSAEEKAIARKKASVKLTEANAHYIIDTIADLPDVLIAIDERIAKGERP